MPFTGIHQGDIVWPDDVENGTTVVCPECEDEMHVRSGHTTTDGILKPRCFAHNPGSTSGNMCPGGESDEHKLMKYVVSRRLRKMFDHGEVQRERGIPGTDRIGDVVVTFDEPFHNFGHGVVAEVQYRHDDKDIDSVTYEYLRSGYSVYWLNESHFTDDYEVVEFPDIISVWPNAVPICSSSLWGGIEHSPEFLQDRFPDELPSRYPIEAKFPPEHFRQHEDSLKNWWRMGAQDYEFDIVHQLSTNNADRSCDTCGEEATVYLFQDSVISTFRCDSHLPADTQLTTME